MANFDYGNLFDLLRLLNSSLSFKKRCLKSKIIKVWDQRTGCIAKIDVYVYFILKIQLWVY